MHNRRCRQVAQMYLAHHAAANVCTIVVLARSTEYTISKPMVDDTMSSHVRCHSKSSRHQILTYCAWVRQDWKRWISQNYYRHQDKNKVSGQSVSLMKFKDCSRLSIMSRAILIGTENGRQGELKLMLQLNIFVETTKLHASFQILLVSRPSSFTIVDYF